MWRRATAVSEIGAAIVVGILLWPHIWRRCITESRESELVVFQRLLDVVPEAACHIVEFFKLTNRACFASRGGRPYLSRRCDHA